MSVSYHFSEKLISEFKKISNNINECKNFLLRIDKSDEITLIYIYLYICKLTEDNDIKNKYSRKANNIYLKYFSNKTSILNEFDWTELKVYNYNLSELFHYNVYCLKESAKITNGRCIFKEDDIIFYRYQIEKQIGKGTYSNVYECFDYKRTQHVAIKAVRNDSKFVNSGRKEIIILEKLNHKSICNFIKYFHIKQHYFIVFQLLKGNIYQYVKSTRFEPMKPHIVSQIAKQLIPVLVYIKSIDVIHADIKPENILINKINDENISVKLSDFGSAMKKSDNFTGYIVSRYYRAPEITLEKKGCCDYAIDMWSLSTIIYELLIGSPLFPEKTEKKLIYAILKELGFPNHTFLYNCKKRKLLESQVEDINSYSTYEKISNIKDIDMNAYEYLCDTLVWNKEDRINCNAAENHKYLLN